MGSVQFPDWYRDVVPSGVLSTSLGVSFAATGNFAIPHHIPLPAARFTPQGTILSADLKNGDFCHQFCSFVGSLVL
jgi:hypothetical protein